MPSNLITFPHAIHNSQALLIVNASEDDIETLAVWLSSQDHEYHIHLYNSDPESAPWSHIIAEMAKTVLVNDDRPGWDYNDYSHKVYHYSSANSLLNYFNQHE
jgi:hypothetical protein